MECRACSTIEAAGLPALQDLLTGLAGAPGIPMNHHIIALRPPTASSAPTAGLSGVGIALRLLHEMPSSGSSDGLGHPPAGKSGEAGTAGEARTPADASTAGGAAADGQLGDQAGSPDRQPGDQGSAQGRFVCQYLSTDSHAMRNLHKLIRSFIGSNRSVIRSLVTPPPPPSPPPQG